jgi:hypothetical protein
MVSESPTYAHLIDLTAANSSEIKKFHQGLIDDMTSYLDGQYQVLRLTEWTLGNPELGGRGQAETILFSALHKNMFLFFSAIELVRRGLYGPACTLLRSIVESLVLAKFCAKARDPSVLNKWRTGKYVRLVEVLDRISRPSFAETREIWKGLNGLVHATIYAQQVSMSYADVSKEIRATLGIIHVLLHWNYHLLTRHFLTASTIYYTRTYGDAVALANARATARTIASKTRREFSENGVRLVREYCANWQIR